MVMLTPDRQNINVDDQVFLIAKRLRRWLINAEEVAPHVLIELASDITVLMIGSVCVWSSDEDLCTLTLNDCQKRYRYLVKELNERLNE